MTRRVKHTPYLEFLTRANGAVYGLRGQKLRCPPDEDGYRTFTPITHLGQGTVRVHRVIAASVWGVSAIVGKQVGHRNGIRDDNRIDNLWIPATVREHNIFDGTTANLTRRQPKSSWLPCACCGDPDGPISDRTPDRLNGKRAAA